MRNPQSVRKLKRDPGIVSRMYFTMLLIGIVYGVFAYILMRLGIPLAFIGVIVLGLAIFQYYMSDRLVMMSTGAKELSEEDAPELFAMIRELADRYGMPMPKVAIIQSAMPNAFATGRNPNNALVAVTTGILQRLTRRELRAVLGHELAHVANRDMKVLAISNFFVTLTSFLMTMFFFNMLFGRRDAGGGSAPFMIAYLVTILVYFVGKLLVLALTRYREYGADHTGAEISGDPGGLADALQKISMGMDYIPDDDLRRLQTAQAFLIAPAIRGFAANMFSTHPPMEERIARLRELEAEMRYGYRN
ncbi:MAG: M48 family metalloprotease [Chloroflexi bacterium]|nr:M48 family metalloprotease [Chloroflexota bacterium]MYK60475.1 M48 family metalloprotease [Chloroflexota bacterium]